MGAENARQKALDVKIQHQVERQALMEKINSLQRDLQQVTQRCGNEVEKAYQVSFANSDFVLSVLFFCRKTAITETLYVTL